MRRAPALALSLIALGGAGCGGANPTHNVVSHAATLAAWTATGAVVYAEPITTAPAGFDLRKFDPGSGSSSSILHVGSTLQYLSADDSDRVLAEGIGGAYTIYKLDGTSLYAVTNLTDVSNGYVSLHLSAGGTKIYLATLPPTPALQIHSATDGTTITNFAGIEGTANLREMNGAPDDSAIYYLKGDPTGTQPDAIVKVSSTNAAAKTTVFQDASIPFLDRIFVSGDGATLLVSGHDASGKTGVWTLPADGSAPPAQIAMEGGSRLTVKAASGLSPDKKRFLLLSSTARGPVLTVEAVPGA